MRGRSRLAVVLGAVGIICMTLMVLLALVGPLVVPHSAKERTGGPLELPSAGHWLGTNDIGQDILAELVVGARVSLTVGVIGGVLVMIIGTLIGMAAGYAGGAADSLLMRFADVSMTLPFLPLMIVIGVFLTPSISTQIFIISIVMWAKVAREIRSQSISLRSRGPMLAAKAMGASSGYILRRHVLPGLFPLLIPQFVQAVNAAIMLESSLSFLGLGDPLAKSWGSMLFYANARSAFLTDAWIWWVFPPGLCIIVTVLGCTFLGYWMEEKASPRLATYASAVRRKAGKPASRAGIDVAAERMREEAVAQTRQESKAQDAEGADGRRNALERSAESGLRDAPAADESAAVIRLQGVKVTFPKDDGRVYAVRDADFVVRPGEIVGIAGESGSGKSTIGSAVMQLLKPPAAVEGAIAFNGVDLAELSAKELRRLRGNRLALIPQAAMNALNPVLSVRSQMREAIRLHRKVSRFEADRRIDELLEQVGLDARWGSVFPHELSGGMKQRVVIAMALLNEPTFIVADEPTTGLDVKVQVEIVQLLERLQKQYGMAMIFISHDLPVVMRIADRMLIVKDGVIVDQGSTDALRAKPNHPYTKKLLDAIPTIGDEGRESACETPTPAYPV